MGPGGAPSAPKACAAHAQHRRGEWRRVYHPPAHRMDASPKVLGTAGVQVRKPQKTGAARPPVSCARGMLRDRCRENRWS